MTGARPRDAHGGAHGPRSDDRDVHQPSAGEYGNVATQSTGPTGAGAPGGAETGSTRSPCTRLTAPSVAT